MIKSIRHWLIPSLIMVIGIQFWIVYMTFYLTSLTTIGSPSVSTTNKFYDFIFMFGAMVTTSVALNKLINTSNHWYGSKSIFTLIMIASVILAAISLSLFRLF